jgi:hypothetical protein
VRLSLELKENTEQVSRAVDRYIDYCLQELTEIQYDKRLQDSVREKMRRKANGTFLWVSLVIKELKDVMSWEVLQVLDEVPLELRDIYHRMIEQIKQLQRQYPELCRQVLSIVIAAYRPLHLQELHVLSGLPAQVRDINQSTAAVVKMCGSFLTIRDNSVYIIHQSAKDFLSQEASPDIFPCGVEDVHYSIFLRSLETMSKVLRRDIYSLRELGYTIEHVKQPDPDPLVATRYSCIYWVDHLCDWNSTSYVNHNVDIRDRSMVDIFIREKYLYWLEALSLCRSMSEGVLSMAKLEAVIQVILRPVCYLRMAHADITLGKSRYICINRPGSRCAPIYCVSQVGNREQSSSGICICTVVQSSLQPDKGAFHGGRAKVDHNKAGYGRQMECLPADARGPRLG